MQLRFRKNEHHWINQKKLKNGKNNDINSKEKKTNIDVRANSFQKISDKF